MLFSGSAESKALKKRSVSKAMSENSHHIDP